MKKMTETILRKGEDFFKKTQTWIVIILIAILSISLIFMNAKKNPNLEGIYIEVVDSYEDGILNLNLEEQIMEVLDVKRVSVTSEYIIILMEDKIIIHQMNSPIYSDRIAFVEENSTVEKIVIHEKKERTDGYIYMVDFYNESTIVREITGGMTQEELNLILLGFGTIIIGGFGIYRIKKRRNKE